MIAVRVAVFEIDFSCLDMGFAMLARGRPKREVNHRLGPTERKVR
jgi:hypothetical protein